MISLKNELNKTFSPHILSIFKNIGDFAHSLNVNAYLVGGCVRDLILKNKIFDIDIVVEANAIEFLNLLKKSTEVEIVEIQENLKTVKAIFDKSIAIDFSSTRKEKYDKLGNLPELSEFGCSLKEDVLRRDFTINTLALRLNDNPNYILTDYLNGLYDIENKHLKIIHNDSFVDDPSRIIRGIKFSVRLGFDFDDYTQTVLKDYIENQINLSMPFERIKGELKQLFSLSDKQIAYDKIIKTGAYKLFSQNVPEIFSQQYFDIAFEKGLIPQQQAWFLPFAFLILNSNLSFERLNLFSLEMKIVQDFRDLTAIKTPDINDNCAIYDMYKQKSNLAIVCKYIYSNDETTLKYLESLKNIKVLINGNDLIALGFKPSILFSEILDKILKRKLNHELLTKEEEIEFAKQFL